MSGVRKLVRHASRKHVHPSEQPVLADHGVAWALHPQTEPAEGLADGQAVRDSWSNMCTSRPQWLAF